MLVIFARFASVEIDKFEAGFQVFQSGLAFFSGGNFRTHHHKPVRGQY
jgi:cell division protein FtsW (lipid II flippase)